jgi:sugar/nucleoside kinase (ribokinase family)
VAVEPYDILIPGHYFCDIIFTGIPGFPALGTELYTSGLTVVPGGSMNTVVGLTRLGARVAWVSTLGSDFFSQFAADFAHSEGIDLSHVVFTGQPLKQVTVSLSYPQDRAFVTNVDPTPDLTPRLFELLETTPVKHLHFSGLQIDERAPDLIRACHARGVQVSMDCQHREETLDSPLVRAIISDLDVFMPNAGEAQKLTQAATLDEAASILRELVPLLVIKDGQNGAHVWWHDDHVHHPALQVELLDTTGAGDIFNAGFLAANLQGLPPAECLEWGNIAGGLSVTGYGGCSKAPTLSELQGHLSR